MFLMTASYISFFNHQLDIHLYKVTLLLQVTRDRYSKGKQINLVSINSVNSAYFVLASHTTTTFSKFSLEKQIWPPHNFCFRSLSLAFITSTMISSSILCSTHIVWLFNMKLPNFVVSHCKSRATFYQMGCMNIGKI